jgi:hypothetical protein
MTDSNVVKHEPDINQFIETDDYKHMVNDATLDNIPDYRYNKYDTLTTKSESIPGNDTLADDLPNKINEVDENKILAKHEAEANRILEILTLITKNKSKDEIQSILNTLLQEIDGTKILHNHNKISITIDGDSYLYPIVSKNDFINKLKSIMPDYNWEKYKTYIEAFLYVLYNNKEYIINKETITQLDKLMLSRVKQILQTAKYIHLGGKLKTRKIKVKKFKKRTHKKFKKQTHKKFKKYKGGDGGATIFTIVFIVYFGAMIVSTIGMFVGNKLGMI